MHFCAAFVAPTPLAGPRSATAHRLPDRLPDRTRTDRSSRFTTKSALAAPAPPSRPLRRSRSNLHIDWIAPTTEPASFSTPSAAFPVHDVRDVAGPDGLTPAQRWEAEMDKLRTNPRQAPDVVSIAAAGVSRSLSTDNIIALGSTAVPTTPVAAPSTANLTNAQKAYYERINRSWGTAHNFSSNEETQAKAASPVREYTQASSTFNVWSNATSSSSSVSNVAPAFSARMDRLSLVVSGQADPVPDVAAPVQTSTAVKPAVSEAEARWRRLAQHAGGEEDTSASSSAKTGSTSSKKAQPSSSAKAASKPGRGNPFSRAVSSIVDKVVDKAADGSVASSPVKADQRAAAASSNAAPTLPDSSPTLSSSVRGSSSAPASKSTAATAPAANTGSVPASSGTGSSSPVAAASTASTSRTKTESSAKTVVEKQESQKELRSEEVSAKKAVADTSASSDVESRAQVERQKKANSVRARGLTRRDTPTDGADTVKSSDSSSKTSGISKAKSGPVAGVKKRESKKKGKKKSKKGFSPLGGPMAIGTSVDGEESESDPKSMMSFTVLVLFTMLCLYLGERFSHLLDVASHSGLF